jgi:hypothetical protein
VVPKPTENPLVPDLTETVAPVHPEEINPGQRLCVEQHEHGSDQVLERDVLVMQDLPQQREALCWAIGAGLLVERCGTTRAGPQNPSHVFPAQPVPLVPPEEPHPFDIQDNGSTLAHVSRRWFSVRDAYAVDVMSQRDATLLLILAVCVDHTLQDLKGEKPTNL